MITLTFADGTLLLDGLNEHLALVGDLCVFDSRVGKHRAKASHYEGILRRLHGKVEYRDEAKAYSVLKVREGQPQALRPYQQVAIDAWLTNKKRGVVVLPTGAGKSYVALRCILATQRSALILVPTIDLVQQWAGDLHRRLGVPIGQYGGGEKNLQDITVSTYDSAVLFMPWHGNRFGMFIADECHHLPAGITSTAAEMCLAPFRLGLSATPERIDGLHSRLDELIGPEVHRTGITELEGNFLASYQVDVVEVALDPDEDEAYRAHRQEYLTFARLSRVDFSRPDGWQQFLSAAARDPKGRAALRVYREQKRLARSGRGKIRELWRLLKEHAGERTIIFTDDNATAYDIGRRFVIPVLTHHTKSAERKHMLDQFRSGAWPVLATSKVLNEGVDVPEAAVGIIVSGSGSVREHVQRLGRILRPSKDKVAMLYEIVTAGTAEGYTSERRRQHAAFGNENFWDTEAP